MIAVPGGAEDATGILKPPGLRLVKDPTTVIPTVHQYPNQNLRLPSYQNPSGRLKEGWAVKVIRTRRFSGNRSARLYFRISDLAGSTAFKMPDSSSEMRIWPLGTMMVLEVYDGDDSIVENGKPIGIEVLAKMDRSESPSSAIFFPVDWSYGRFTAEGESALLPGEVQKCHRCHSIAFHLTGDLIFTQFLGP